MIKIKKSKIDLNEMTLEQCFRFQENPHLHPMLDKKIKIGSPEYKKIINVCGEKIAQGIKHGFPTVEDNDRKKLQNLEKKRQESLKERLAR